MKVPLTWRHANLCWWVVHLLSPGPALSYFSQRCKPSCRSSLSPFLPCSPLLLLLKGLKSPHKSQNHPLPSKERKTDEKIQHWKACSHKSVGDAVGKTFSILLVLGMQWLQKKRPSGRSLYFLVNSKMRALCALELGYGWRFLKCSETLNYSLLSLTQWPVERTADTQRSTEKLPLSFHTWVNFSNPSQCLPIRST